MSKGFITLTVVFEGMSLNRDEGMGNIQTLHLLHRGNGKTYSYMSRQALTYAVRKKMLEIGKNDEQYSPYLKECPVAGDNAVNQWVPLINLYFEPDLFGYMVTSDNKSITRPAPVTFTHAISMEPYEADTAFYANHEMVRRREGADPNPYVRQEHLSLYKYSLVIDLDRIGEDNMVIDVLKEYFDNILEKELRGDKNIQIEKEIEEENEKIIIRKSDEIIGELKKYTVKKNNKKIEKYKGNVRLKCEPLEKKGRIESLISAIFYLSHQISGKNEPLYPIFVAAAHIKYGTPIFHNYVELDVDKNDIYKSYLQRDLFDNALKKVKNIVIDDRVVWGIEEGAGDAHLMIELDGAESVNKVEETIKNWIGEIYK